MKALIVYRDDPTLIQQPCSFHNTFSVLPDTEVIDCTSYEAMKQNLKDTDVIFFLQLSQFEMTAAEHEDILKLNDNKGLFLAYTSLDPWAGPRFNRQRRVDVLFHGVLRPYLKRRKEFTMHYLPLACNIHKPVVKDFDVLIWGKINEKYPFRQHASKVLFDHVVRNGEVIDGQNFYTKIVKFGDKEYTFAFLHNSMHYCGDALYDILARARIVPTGPHRERQAVGKYYEDAACQAVTISCDFPDRLSLGFKHKEHLWITTEAEFEKDLTFLLEHPDLVSEIGANAQELMRYRHTPEVRAWELKDYIFARTLKE